MNHSLTKVRSLNSHIEYNADFSNKEVLNINVNWFIEDRLVNTRIIELNIVKSEIQWIGCPSICEDDREYFNKVLKLIAFG